jgi:hypothetical protein
VLVALCAPLNALADMPVLDVLVVRTPLGEDQVAAALDQVSLAGNGKSFIVPALSGSRAALLNEIQNLTPKVAADALYQATTRSGTAVDLYQGSTVVTLRVKGTGIVGERFRMWLGLQISQSGKGPLKILEQIAIQGEIAYGEALVAPITDNLVAVIIAGPFDPQPEAPSEASGAATEPDATPEQPREPSIIWDAAPGAVLPDTEFIETLKN